MIFKLAKVNKINDFACPGTCMCGSDAKGGLPLPSVRLMRGGGYPGGATESTVLHTNGGVPPPKPPVLLRGGTRGHMYENRSWGVGGISVNSFLIGTGGGYPPPADRAAVLLRGVTPPHTKRRHCCYHVGGYPPPIAFI